MPVFATLFLKALLVWVTLLVAGSLLRLCINPRTMRKELALRQSPMTAGLTGRELFKRINNEYGGIFCLDYTAEGYGKAVPTVGLSRLSFSLDMFRRSDYGTVYVPRACGSDRSLMAAALVSHEVGHLILLTRRFTVLFSVMLQRFIMSASAVVSTLCVVGYATMLALGLGNMAWPFVAVASLIAAAWVFIVVNEWKATTSGLAAARSAKALTEEEAVSCKEIGRLWVLTYAYKLYIFTVPLLVMAIMGMH